MREISIGEFYHCYNRGTEKRKIFLTGRDYLRFTVLLYVCNSDTPIHVSNFEAKSLIELFELERGKPLVAIGAWSLMPNHFHLLLKEIRENGISLFMQKLTIAYTMYFNKKFDRTGALLGSTFKSEHLTKDTYLKYIFSYLHLNSIKLIDADWKESRNKDWKKYWGFLSEFRWSSYLDYKGSARKEGRILNNEEFPKYFRNEKDFDAEIKDWLTFGTVHGKIQSCRTCRKIKTAPIYIGASLPQTEVLISFVPPCQRCPLTGDGSEDQGTMLGWG